MCFLNIILDCYDTPQVSILSFSHMLINLQCYEGKPLFEFDRTRTFRSGLVGFLLHGSLSHYYYQFCEVIIVAIVCFSQLIS